MNLCKFGKYKSHKVHRMVANAFIPNINNLPQVGHNNDIPTDNCVENLYWTDNKENSIHNNKNLKIAKSVYCIELNQVFESTIFAGKKLDISHSHISMCCKGKRKTCGGYHWKYYKEIV